MTNKLKVFSERPYYDDYDADKGFLQVLFRPSLAVQARELTQLQTILQDQIARVGGHFFDNGARIINGETKLWNRIQYIKFQSDFTPASNHDYSKCIIKKNGTELTGKVVHSVAKNSTDPFTVYIEYIKSEEATTNFVAGDELEITVFNTDNSEDFTLTTNPIVNEVGYGALFSVNSGIYFINSRFVLVQPQTLVLSKYDDITEGDSSEINIGFKVDDIVVGPETDASLFDNAVGSTNESAPGATRYRMVLTLVLKDDLSVDDVAKYVQILIVKKGVATENPNLTDYTKTFLEIFARRTYDESGDYVINDFLLDVREHLDDGTNRGLLTLFNGGDANKVSLGLDPGKAYVRGFEVATQTDTLLETDKARTDAYSDDTFISMPFDAYVLADINNDLGNNTIPLNLFFNTNGRTSLEKLYFKNSSNVTLFTAYPLSIEHTSGDRYKIKFVGLTQSVSNAILTNVVKISSAENFMASTMQGLNASVKLITTNVKLLYKLPYSYVGNFLDALFIDFKTYSTGIKEVSPNNYELILPSNATTPSNASIALDGEENYIVYFPTEARIATVGVKTGDTLSFTCTGISSGSLASVIYKSFRNSPIISQKVLNEITQTFTISDNKKIQLDKTDGYSLTSITSGSVDYTASYSFDNGQRDDVYDFITLNSISGVLPANGSTITVTYKYFSHTEGDFFIVDSYLNNGFVYDDIPLYKNEFLGNYVDLRKSINTKQTTVSTNSTFIAKYNFYLPRKDKIILNKNGQFNVLKGVPSLSPQAPKDADDSITLYELNIPAYTFKSSDISVSKLNYKRYTMKDIAQIERRVEDLEYYTSLSLLEADIQGKEFFDKFKSGFFVDNFESLTTADAESHLHAIAIDFVNNEVRPEVVVKAINIEPVVLSNCVNNNGIITLAYTEKEMIRQNMAAIIERIQPFTKYTWSGKARLNPPFDNWVTTNFVDLTLDNGTFPASRQAEVMNNVWDSVGRFFVGNPVNGESNQSLRLQTAGNTQVPTGDTRIGWDREAGMNQWARPVVTTQTQFVGPRLLDVGLVPFIRSRVVEFTITGLKPNTKVLPYFDGVDMTGYSSTAITSNIYNGTSTDDLVSSGAGELHGYFFIPNNDSIRFKTGSKRFQVMDKIENPSTSASGTYIANGVNFDIQNVFVTTRFVGSETVWYDPVAQSFLVENPDGAFITSIDLFFGPDAVDNTEPVKVQIRDMKNGLPGTQTVTETILYANQISGSNDSSIATRFTFNNPVFLESGKEYCFVVITNSVDLTIWTSKLGEKDVLSGQYINRQPYLGSMFKSQNNSTWTTEQLQDIKFVMNRAVFSTSGGEVIAYNRVATNDVNTEADPFHKRLQTNPFYALISDSTPQVHVTHKNHGFVVGDSVTITGAVSTDFSYPSSVLNATHKIISVPNVDEYIITPTPVTPLTANIVVGGSTVLASQQINYSGVRLLTDAIVTNGTNLAWKLTPKTLYASSIDANEIGIIEGSVLELGAMKIVRSGNDDTMKLRGVITTASDFLSPVIDADRLTIYTYTNRISAFKDEDVNNVYDAKARYLSKQITLINPANEIQVYLDNNIPTGTGIDVYCKVSTDQVSHYDDNAWNKMNVVSGGVYSDKNEFTETKYVYPSSDDTSSDFSNFIIKVVYFSKSEVTDVKFRAVVPRSKRLRGIALKTGV